jgi:hypothetical protein
MHIYSAQPRFLTFAEAELLDRLTNAHIEKLERWDSPQARQEIEQARALLRSLVYFTTADKLEEIESYLLAQGWERIATANSRLHVFSRGETSLALPAGMHYSDAEDFVIRAMYELAFLEGPDTATPYDMLLRIRYHADHAWAEKIRAKAHAHKSEE